MLIAPACPPWMLADLSARYGEPQRRYHTAAHVRACLEARAVLCADLAIVAPAAVDLALLFHDAIYQPLAIGNEVRSAGLLVELGRRAGFDEALLTRAATLVRLTQHGSLAHDGEANAEDAALVLDADLSILGADAATFDRYERDVRAEYARVDDASFARGRAHVLAAILRQPAIYRTRAGRARWEEAARANLGRSLAALSPPSPAEPLAPAARTSGSSRSGSAAAPR